MVSGIPGLDPPEARGDTCPHLQVWQPKDVFRSCQMSPEEEAVLAENCCPRRGTVGCSGCQNPCTRDAHPSVSCGSFTHGPSSSLSVQSRRFSVPLLQGSLTVPPSGETTLPLLNPEYSSRSTLGRFQYTSVSPPALTLGPQTTRCSA